jgi:hypothetical protein
MKSRQKNKKRNIIQRQKNTKSRKRTKREKNTKTRIFTKKSNIIKGGSKYRVPDEGINYDELDIAYSIMYDHEEHYFTKMFTHNFGNFTNIMFNVAQLFVSSPFDKIFTRFIELSVLDESQPILQHDQKIKLIGAIIITFFINNINYLKSGNDSVDKMTSKSKFANNLAMNVCNTIGRFTNITPYCRSLYHAKLFISKNRLSNIFDSLDIDAIRNSIYDFLDSFIKFPYFKTSVLDIENYVDMEKLAVPITKNNQVLSSIT